MTSDARSYLVSISIISAASLKSVARAIVRPRSICTAPIQQSIIYASSNIICTISVGFFTAILDPRLPSATPLILSCGTSYHPPFDFLMQIAFHHVFNLLANCAVTDQGRNPTDEMQHVLLHHDLPGDLRSSFYPRFVYPHPTLL
jgi:hypothetical protein